MPGDHGGMMKAVEDARRREEALSKARHALGPAASGRPNSAGRR